MGAHPMRAVLSLTVAALLALSAGCGKAPSLSSLAGGGRAEQPKEPAGMKAVSPIEPAARAPLEIVATFPNLELVPSQGDCAPRYANGQMGSCINSRPCRGLGMRTPRGAAECRCWTTAGGCREGERCDGVVKACVPENRPESGRAEVE